MEAAEPGSDVETEPDLSLLLSILSIICWILDHSRFSYIRNRQCWWLLGLVRRTATVALMFVP